MRFALALSLILCGTTAAQATSENAASDSFRQRMLSMNLLNPPKRFTLRPLTVAAAPNVCSIPLLTVKPLADGDRMHVVKPSAAFAGSRDELSQVPAPACEAKAR